MSDVSGRKVKRNDRLTLVGYRGTGKTSVARMLSERLGWDSVDADVELERVAGRTIAEIFAEDGEPAFRDLESQVIGDLVKYPKCVIASGGGVVLREENRDAISESLVVWLTATPRTLSERIGSDAKSATQRPDLTEQGGLAEIKSVLRERHSLYESVADMIVATDGKTPREIAAEIVIWLESR